MDVTNLKEVADLPKVELHLHHEGAAPPKLIRQLAWEKGIDVSGIFSANGSYDYEGFGEFLQVYESATQVLGTPEDYGRLTSAILRECADNATVYVETFLSPDFCGGGDLEAWCDYLAAIREAADQAERELGVILRGIVTCVRHFGVDRAIQTARCAVETAGDWVVGFGMGGDEGFGHQRDFKTAFDMAREAGLRLTTHAGEWGGAAEVRDAINDLGVERIGHGVGAADDPELMRELAERGIVLEVCPGSNIALGVYRTLSEHPIDKLRREGVKVTVSTDDPPFFHTSLRTEYEALARVFGWSADECMVLNRTAAEAAFCDPETRASVMAILDAAHPERWA